ncbi:MAG: PP2C family protein-serine/threonine phosphatase [Planctomycetota bacterium]
MTVSSPRNDDSANETPGNWKPVVYAEALSDIGMRRANNQDSFAIVIATDGEKWQRAGDLLIVADGMGAHAAGELASRLSVELIPHHYSKLHTKLDCPEAIVKAFEETNREINLRGTVNPEFRSMGTTTSAIVLLPIGGVIAHVGDSRVYRLRGQTFEQLTFDHSLVWEMQSAGEVSEEMIRNSSIPKNVITRSLGPSPNVQVDIEGPFPLLKGDRFLLCSDGLSGQIADEEIGLLLGLLDPATAVKALVDLANFRGGPDNITVVIGEIQRDFGVTNGALAGGLSRNSPGFPTSFGIISAIGLLAAASLALVQQLPLAILAAAAALVALITGWIKMAVNKQPGAQPKGFGKAPYRKYTCKPSAPLANHLKNAVDELYQWLKKNSHSPNLESLASRIQAADREIAAKDYKASTATFAKLLVDVMQEIRDRRKEDQEGHVDY